MKRLIELDAQKINYQFRINKLNKHIRITVSNKSGLLVTAPPGTSLKSIEQVLQANKVWILDKLLELANRAQESKPNLVNGDRLTVLGEAYRLTIQNGPGVRFSVEFDNIEFKVQVPMGLTPGEEQIGISRVLAAWFTRQAKAVIPQRVSLWAKAMDLEFNHITVRDQKSRWGSCSQLRNLNFNWRLVMAPLPILDYVIVHELAHLRELNHSTTFWQLVESFCPEHKRHKQWLKTHGQELFVL